MWDRMKIKETITGALAKFLTEKFKTSSFKVNLQALTKN